METKNVIYELRTGKGMSQDELAEKLFVTRQAVSRWETGKGLPDTALLSPLASALGVTVGELLAGERIAREERSEKTDEVILDALRYARARISAMLCTAVLAVGIALLLSPLWLAAAGICAYSVLGLVLIVTALLRKLLERKRASDAVLRLVQNVTDGLHVNEKVVDATVREYLPFIATENLMMEGVKRGGDRQQLHEIIRECSMAATAKMKEGEPCDLLSRLAAQPAFGMTEAEMEAVLDPKLYIGRCPEQVDAFLSQVRPLLSGASEEKPEINL